MSMMLLPPKPDVCQKCAVDHKKELPHDQTSMYWQYWFYSQYERWPTWADAMEHCTDEMKKVWSDELRKRGIDI